MTTRLSFSVILRLSAQDEAAPGVLEATAEAILEALHRDAPFVAIGPVMSVDLVKRIVEAECTVYAVPEDLHVQINRIMQVMLDAAESFEYQGSSTERIESAVLA